MILRITLISAFFLGCVEDNSVVEETKNFKTKSDVVWICHHPDSEHHGNICDDSEYPAGCLVKGDNTKFCWALYKEDCLPPLDQDWQMKNCHFYE